MGHFIKVTEFLINVEDSYPFPLLANIGDCVRGDTYPQSLQNCINFLAEKCANLLAKSADMVISSRYYNKDKTQHTCTF